MNLTRVAKPEQPAIVAPRRAQPFAQPRAHILAGKLDRVLVDAPCSGTGTCGAATFRSSRNAARWPTP